MNKLILICLIIVFFALPVVAQQVDTSWVRRYDGPTSGDDRANALVIDGSGNVYVTGYTTSPATGPDYATIKYDSIGTQLWVRTFNGAGNGVDVAVAMVLDGNLNIDVTGYSWGAGTNYDYVTRRYDPSGNLVWSLPFNWTNNSDMAVDIAADPYGNVYVTGSAYAGPIHANIDFYTFMYLPGGGVSWGQFFNGNANGDDSARAIAVDASGNVYVTGQSKFAANMRTMIIVKYNAGGGFGWQQNIGTPNLNSYGFDVVTDGAYVYATGRGNGAGFDYITAKFAADGTMIWIKNYNGPGNGNDEAKPIAIDASGNVYVTGYSIGSGTNEDYATIKYRPNGDTAWVRRYDNPEHNHDFANAIAIDASGNVYVTGQSYTPSTGWDYTTVKYDSSGNQKWVQTYNGPAGINDVALSIAVSNRSNVYVTGYSEGVGTDYDYATIEYWQDYQPVVTAVDSTKFLCLPDTIRFTVTAIDSDATDSLTLSGPGIPVPLKGVSPLSTDAKIYVNSTGTYDYVYTVTDGRLIDSDTATWVITMNTPPNAFVLLTPDSGAFTPSIVNFDWQDAFDPDSWDTVKYDLYLSTSPTFNPDSTIMHGSLLTSQHSDTFEVGTYYWKVRAYDKCTENWSNQTWNFTIFPDTLVGYWMFNEGSGNIAYDSSGYGNDGALMNEPSWVNGLPILGKALDFDGADDYIRINDNDIISSVSLNRAMTVMAWVKPDTGFLNVLVRVVASHWTDYSGSCPVGGQSNSWTLEAHQNDGKYHVILTNGVSFKDLTSKTPAKEGVWQHVAFTWDGSLITFYFYGIADTSVSYTGDLANSSCYMQIGRTDYVWKGLLDEVKLYNRALSPEKIKAEFESGFVWGDANADAKLSVSDVVYLINYLFKGGPAPIPEVIVGDANCDGKVNVSDVVYLINYLFKGGPKPAC